jgi:hypothetical protein
VKLYCAATGTNFAAAALLGYRRLQRREARVLFSFHYFTLREIRKTLDEFADLSIDLFIDSGAYSAKSQGAVIDLKEYAAFLKELAKVTTVAASLDVIGDARASHDNLQRLEDAGAKVMPVFHAGEQWEYLARYIEHYRYIGLGGLVGARGPLEAWLVRCFKMAAGTDTIFHAFGMNAPGILRQFPFGSADASSWSVGARYGRIPTFDRAAQRFVLVKTSDWKSVYKYAPLWRSVGIDPHALCRRHGDKNGNEKQDHRSRAIAGAMSIAWLEDWLNEVHASTRSLKQITALQRTPKRRMK